MVLLELLDGLEHQGGLDGRGVLGESLQGTAEAIVVELFDGQPEGVGHRGGLGPLADAGEGLGMGESVGDQDLDEAGQEDARAEVDDGSRGVRRRDAGERSAGEDHAVVGDEQPEVVVVAEAEPVGGRVERVDGRVEGAGPVEDPLPRHRRVRSAACWS